MAYNQKMNPIVAAKLAIAEHSKHISYFAILLIIVIVVVVVGLAYKHHKGKKAKSGEPETVSHPRAREFEVVSTNTGQAI